MEDISIAVSVNSTVHVAWSEDLARTPGAGGDSAYYAVIGDSAEFPPILIAHQVAEVYMPRIAISQDNSVHILWTENDLFPDSRRMNRLLHAQISGDSVSGTDTLVSLDSLSAYPMYYGLAIAHSQIYAYWTQPRESKTATIWLKGLRGKSWTPAAIMFPSYSEPPSAASQPNLFSALDNSLHMVFIGRKVTRSTQEWENEGFIRYSAKAVSDSLWPEPVLVYGNRYTYHFWPQVVVDHNATRHVVWQEDLDQDFFHLPDALYYSYSDNGTDWSEPRNISQMGPSAFWPQVVIDSHGIVHVVWGQIDFLSVGTYKGIVYTSGREDSWSEPQIIFDSYPVMLSPDLAIDSNDRLHLVGATGDPRNLSTAIEYSWRDPDSALAVHEPRWLNAPSELPLSFKNYPNPFNSTTFFEIEAQTPLNGSLIVYNLRGEIVHILFQQENISGRAVFAWDGKNMNARDVPSGIYFGVLEGMVSNRRVNRIMKVLLIK